MSTEVEIFCNQADCGLVNFMSMVVGDDQMYGYAYSSHISVYKGKSNDAVIKNSAKNNAFKNSAISNHLLINSYFYMIFEAFNFT